MIIPTREQIYLVTTLLRDSIQSLINNDSSLFAIDVLEPQNISKSTRKLNRKLHEVTINHRLAYYLEQNIQNTVLRTHSVDIEYNRYYLNPKLVVTVDGLESVRPDILIHSRVNDQIQPQHFLVIEAKKGQITQHDINKVKGLISDDNYSYIFGYTVSYCSDSNHVIGNLYYYNGTNIETTSLNVIRNTHF